MISYDCQCGQTLQWDIMVEHIHKVLYFELQLGNIKMAEIPPLINIPQLMHSQQYRLAAIIYHGFNHYTARFILINGDIWNYDGRINKGTPRLEGNISSVGNSDLNTCCGRMAHIALYALKP